MNIYIDMYICIYCFVFTVNREHHCGYETTSLVSLITMSLNITVDHKYKRCFVSK